VHKCSDQVDEDGNTILHKAVRNCYIDGAKFLITNGMDVNVSNQCMDAFSDGGQPIHVASQQGSIEIVEFLVNVGASINSQANYNKDTPLHLAVEFGHSDLCKVLLAKGADPTALNSRGVPPLETLPDPKIDDECRKLFREAIEKKTKESK